MESDIACLICGVEQHESKYEKCVEDISDGLISGFDHQKHIWRGRIKAEEWYGKGIDNLADNQ